MRCTLLVALTYSLCAASAAADAANATDCATIVPDQERLQCYDAAAGPSTPSGTTKASGEVSPDDHEQPPSALARRWELEAAARHGAFVMSAFRPNYILPLTYNSNPNQDPARPGAPIVPGTSSREIEPVEMKFQISVKVKAWEHMFHKDLDLWLAYTQLAFWQAYNSKASAPFRETNYEPEAVFSLRTNYSIFGLNGRVITLELDHQSNGRSEPLSRSWNRVIGGTLLERGNLALWIRAWYRIPESADQDDNPDILDYMGHGDVVVAYKHGAQTYSLMLRNNLRKDNNRGAVQLDWSFPMTESLRGYVQYFNGYGESLIDYNHSSNRLGVGLMLTDWL